MQKNTKVQKLPSRLVFLGPAQVSAAERSRDIPALCSLPLRRALHGAGFGVGGAAVGQMCSSSALCLGSAGRTLFSSSPVGSCETFIDGDPSQNPAKSQLGHRNGLNRVCTDWLENQDKGRMLRCARAKIRLWCPPWDVLNTTDVSLSDNVQFLQQPTYSKRLCEVFINWSQSRSCHGDGK